MENALIVNEVSHQFAGKQVLHSLSFVVGHGEVFTMLGPNGAGKTTTIRLMNGLYNPSAGDIKFLGMNPILQGAAVRSICGVLTETNALYERLTAKQNLHFFGRLYGLTESVLLKRTEEVLEFFDLRGRENDRVGAYSKGMKQRLALARAILHNPKILFLDEPTSSLDPESTMQVHDLIRSIRSAGETTIFLCTHHLEEAQKLSDRLAILNQGKLIALGSLTELGAQFNPGVWVEITLHDSKTNETRWAGLKMVKQVEFLNENSLRVEVETENDIPCMITELVQNGVMIYSVTPQHASLEEIYFRLQAGAL